MRAVGYRQIWSCLEQRGSLEDAEDKALAATRQMAKRQLTWYRKNDSIIWFDYDEKEAVILNELDKTLNRKPHE